MADQTRAELLDLIKDQGEVVRKLKAAKADSAKVRLVVDYRLLARIKETNLQLTGHMAPNFRDSGPQTL